MLGEMRTAALIGKLCANSARAVRAEDVLHIATLGGARAVGLDSKIGSIEIGKHADLITLSISDVESLPLFDPISHVVYTLGRQEVSDVWVDGKHLLNQRTLTTIDLDDLLQRIRVWDEKISSTFTQSE
jgi:5-methylthioadenosine/S-adenosylhomocysteine deaminase